MKKISLKDIKNGLRRDEMRAIQGGGCGCCGQTVNYMTVCGVSSYEAQSYAGAGGRWCCSSCGSATWL